MGEGVTDRHLGRAWICPLGDHVVVVFRRWWLRKVLTFSGLVVECPYCRKQTRIGPEGAKP